MLVRETLNSMVELIQTSLGKACQTHGCTSHIRDFSPRDDVSVLLPTTKKHLPAQWQGLHLVVHKVGCEL